MAREKTPADALRQRETDRAEKRIAGKSAAPKVVESAREARKRQKAAARALTPAERAGNLVIDLFTCVCFTAAVVVALFQLTGFRTSLWYILLLSAAGTGLILLFAWKWWIPTGVLTLGVGVVFLIAWIRDAFPQLFLYWEGFYDWIYSGMAKVEPYASNGSGLLVAFLFVLPVALVFYLYCRKLSSFWVSLALTVAITSALEFTDNPQAVPALCLMLCGLLLALPGVVTRIANKGKSEDQIISRHAMQLVAIPLSIFCVFMGWVFGPHDNGAWKNENLNDLVGDLGDVISYVTGQNINDGSDFTLRSTGYQPLGSRLGGDLQMKSTAALEVDTDTPILLAGDIGDTYDGRSWSDGFDTGRFRYPSLFWRGCRNNTFQSALPLGDGYVRQLYRDITVDARLVVSTELRNTNAFFSSGRVENVTVRYPATGLTAYFNLQGELFANRKSTMIYVLETTAFDPSDFEYREKLCLMETALLEQKVTDPYYPEISTRYLGISDTVEPSVYRLVEEILAEAVTPTNPVDTPMRKALALEQWLSENATYTITPGEVPADRDFVSYFLETREGYCTYYASALAIMCRVAGIPSRYVTGFALERFYGSGADYTARSNNAHAWTEVYIQGIGWVTLDALGPRDALADAAEPEEEEENVSAPVTTPSATPTPPPTPTPVEGITEVPKINERKFSVWVFVIPGVILLGIAGAIVYVTRARTKYERCYAPHRVVFFCLTAERAADYLYDGILRQLRFFELRPKPGETMLDFAARTDDYLRWPSGDESAARYIRMKQVAEIMMRLRYGQKKLKQEDVDLLGGYFKQVEGVLKEYLGESGYFWKRASERIPKAK